MGLREFEMYTDDFILRITDTPAGIFIPCEGEMHLIAWDLDGKTQLRHHPETTEEDMNIARAFRAMGKAAPVCFRIEDDVKRNIITFRRYQDDYMTPSSLNIDLGDYFTEECALIVGTEFTRKGSKFDAFMAKR